MTINDSNYLFTVTDRLAIEGRGIVLFPGIPIDESTIRCNRGDPLILRTPLGDILHTNLQDIELIRRDPSVPHQGVLISLPKNVHKFDVPIGTEVYLNSSK